MVKTASTMLPLGTPAPDFELADPAGKRWSLASFDAAPVLVVAFWCNHCPFVQHVRQGFLELAREYSAREVAVVAINANDVESHPEDSPARMAEEIRSHRYPFPYLFDERQEVAKAYRAACTPDFFVFGPTRRLEYRGQLDDSRPGNGIPVTGADLRTALDALLTAKPVPAEQKPSIGCNIKWKPGKEPDFFPR